MSDTSDDHLQRFGASLVASGIAETLTLPTDVAKVRLQVQSNKGLPAYSGMFDCLYKVAQNEGISACWKGLSPALIRQCCYSSFALVLYEPIRNFFRTEEVQELTFWQRLLAGGTAGAISIAVFNWTEVLKTQMQTSKEGTTMTKILTRVYQNEGLLGFWSGLKPNIARTFLVNAAELGTYDQSKTMLIPYVGDNAFAHLGASTIAGVASACTSTPADVVKTRLMNNAGGVRVYTGVFNAFSTILREEGAMAFYKGFVPICVRKMLWCSVFFVSYEKLRALLNTQ